MIRIHAACLPAFCPPALTKSPNPATAEPPERLIFSPPTKREGVKKGSFGSCFGLSTFRREAVKQYPESPAERGRTIILIPSPHTRPLLPHKHMHIYVPLPPQRGHCYLAEMSRNQYGELHGNSVRCFGAVTLRGPIQRNVTATAVMSSRRGKT